jgi:hypothetical protein
MEPISAVVISLALGAGAIAGKEVVSSVVKDAYGKLKELLKSRYPRSRSSSLKRRRSRRTAERSLKRI